MSRIRREFSQGADVDLDRLSAPEPFERRAVHPYRDRREALIARRRALAQELAEAERAAERKERLARRVAVIDDELRASGAALLETALLETIAIETPCRARWEEMRGSDVVRHCPRCDRDVHDLTHMTQAEIERLFARAAHSPCVRLRRRSDGRVVTADCPSERPTALARAARVIAVSVLAGASAGVVVAVASAPILGGARASVGTAPLELAPAELTPPDRAPAIDLDALRSAPRMDDEVEIGAPALARAITDDDLDRHIRWIAPQAWEIDRVLVDRASSMGSIASAPRLIPYERGGRVVGVRVYGVRRASLLGRLGVRNGDTIIDVNGLPADAMPDEGFTLLRDADALFVRLERRGEERVHVYRITG